MMSRLRFAALACVALVGCNNVIPVPDTNFAVGTFTSTIVSALAFHSYMEPTPAPVIPDDERHSRDKCPNGGWIRNGDGHTTRCPYCDPPYTAMNDIVDDRSVLANMAPPPDSKSILQVPQLPEMSDIDRLEAEVDEAIAKQKKVNELKQKLNAALPKSNGDVCQCGCENCTCATRVATRAPVNASYSYGSNGSSLPASNGSNGSSMRGQLNGYGSNGSSYSTASYSNASYTASPGIVVSSTPLPAFATQRVCTVDAYGNETCQTVQGARAKTYGVVGYGPLGRPLYGWR